MKQRSSPMRIWIDGYEANVPQRLGSGQVAFELLKNIEKLDKKNDYTILLAAPPLPDMPNERPLWRYRILKVKRFKTWVAIPLALFFNRARPDLIFSPTHYGPGFSPVKSIISIFDLSFLRFPKFFKLRDLKQLTLWTWISVKKASHVVTISQATKNDIIDSYKIGKEKITIAYPGYDRTIFGVIDDRIRINAIQDKYQTGRSYIIYIGTIQPRKNLIRLMEAFAKVTLDKTDLKLVIVGKTTGVGRQGWMFEDILETPSKLGIEDKVVFTGYVPQEDLPLLLNGATAYILPSLWEGFGIPVVEAMACGTPVLVSNVSSLPEVVGDAGLLFDPASLDQIEQAIRLIVSDKKLRVRKAKMGLKQAEKYSWEKMAKIVLKTFEGVANG